MAKKRKKVYLIVLNYNGKSDTLECLKSLKKMDVDGLPGGKKNWLIKTIVVDNGSTDKSKQAIEKKFSKVKLIRLSKNQGFSGGNNVGLKYALKQNSDYCLLLNNDTVVDKNTLIQLIKVMEKDQKIGLVSPKIYFAPGFEFFKKRYKENEKGSVIWYAGGKIDWKNVLASHRGVDEVDIGRYEKVQKTDFATGCCMLVRKEAIEKIGLLDDKYFLYWEDNDFCQRAKKAGYKVLYAPDAAIWHKNAGSTGVGSALHDYYLTRNRLLFAFKYASLRAKIALIKESILKLFQGRKWQKKGIIDFYLGRFKKGSWR